MCGSVAAGCGIFLAIAGFIIPFIGAGASVALGARRLGVAAIASCVLATFFGWRSGTRPRHGSLHAAHVSVSHSFLPGTHA